MKKNLILLSISIAALTFFGCSKESTKPTYSGTSTFPLTTGSRWVYERNYYYEPFINPALADTQSYMVYRRVIGPDTIINSCQTYIVDDSTSIIDSVDSNPFVDRHWLGISDSKLKEFAELIVYPWEDTVPVFFAQPRILLDFPLVTGKAWTAYPMVLGNVYNSVAGIEYITVGDQEIKCDVVRSQLIDPGTGHRFYDSYWWYSNDGLIRNEFDYGNAIISDSLGNPVDSIRHLETMELISMQIQP